VALEIRMNMSADEKGPAKRKRNGLLQAVGSGVITGAADDDPSGIGTYATAGAKFGLSFLWIAPVALVWSGIVQGFSVPPLLLLMMLMSNDRKVMGDRVNSRFTNILGWITTAATFCATGCLVVSWLT
jgi:Mn2+/Fe2+ NRAMP family transporter